MTGLDVSEAFLAGARQALALVREHGIRVAAVSYTHLTLPTSDLV